jgi:hypothetical protein
VEKVRRRWNFWYRNYQKFLDEGLEYYRWRGDMKTRIVLLEEFHGTNME